MSGNHNGDLERALDIVRAAGEAGAHALKIQTYTADTITLDVDSPMFRLEQGPPAVAGPPALRPLHRGAHPVGLARADLRARPGARAWWRSRAPFDPTAVDFLVGLGVPLLKSASSEITDLPLIRAIAGTGLPTIISTGTATLGEIDQAVRAARETGNDDVVVLSCTASYPAPPESSNLRGIPVLRDALDVQVGLSDHTLGIGASVAAVAMGATVIEKHLTLSRDEGGVDADFSLDPSEFASLVAETRIAWQAMGEARIGPEDDRGRGAAVPPLAVRQPRRQGRREGQRRQRALGAPGRRHAAGLVPRDRGPSLPRRRGQGHPDVPRPALNIAETCRSACVPRSSTRQMESTLPTRPDDE